VPIWGKPEEGTAADKPLNTPLCSESVQLLARPGVAPGASISLADAALVTAAKLAALRAPPCAAPVYPPPTVQVGGALWRP
jgi:hypothetical protein